MITFGRPAFSAHKTGTLAGRIVGNVYDKALPVNLPRRERVYLYEHLYMTRVTSMLPASDGAYAFEYIDPSREYFVIAFDRRRLYGARISDRLPPDPMP